MASTTINAYNILEQVRYDLNEYSTAYVQATDTTGSYQNAHLMRKINEAQRIVWNALFAAIPDAFLKSADLTISSSVASLPSDFYRIAKLETSDEIKVEPIPLQDKHRYDDEGSEYLYYRYGNYLRIDADSVSRTDTLWYYFRPRELNQGLSTAGAATSITLAASARTTADYYNGMGLENITDDWTDTITDYTAARVCTITNTGAASKYYGLISDMPEAFHHLIAPRATILCRVLPQSMKLSASERKQERDDWAEMLSESLRGYAGTNFSDVLMDELFNDFEL